MPPASHELDLSIRFKHGVHTIFLFVDPTAPFSAITTDLLDVLRERYPQGLTRSLAPHATTSVPASGDDVRVSYAVLVNPYDATDGWRNLNIKGSETPLQMGLEDNMIVAFALQDPADDEDPEWVVEWPAFEEEEEEEPRGRARLDEDDDL